MSSKKNQKTFDTKVEKVDDLVIPPEIMKDIEHDLPISCLSETIQKQLQQAVKLLSDGEVVAMPTETVYGLAGNALDAHVVPKIFEAKNRPSDNPLIVHISSLDMLRRILPGGKIPDVYLPVLHRFWPGPLTIILPKSEVIPEVVTAGQSTVAVRFPKHPIARALIGLCQFPLAAPSANSSGKPSPTLASHVYHDLVGRIPLILDGGACNFGVESTVLDGQRHPPAILRPGSITYEQLREVKGMSEVQVYRKDFVDKKLEQAPTTPGMKYRHYSPDATVILVEYCENTTSTKLSTPKTLSPVKKINNITSSTPNTTTTTTDTQTVNNKETEKKSENEKDEMDENKKKLLSNQGKVKDYLLTSSQLAEILELPNIASRQKRIIEQEIMKLVVAEYQNKLTEEHDEKENKINLNLKFGILRNSGSIKNWRQHTASLSTSDKDSQNDSEPKTKKAKLINHHSETNNGKKDDLITAQASQDNICLDHLNYIQNNKKCIEHSIKFKLSSLQDYIKIITNTQMNSNSSINTNTPSSNNINTSSSNTSRKQKDTIIEVNIVEYFMGDREQPNTIAAELFKALRFVDAIPGIKAIFIEGIPDLREGLAVMNRIRKASSKIIKY